MCNIQFLGIKIADSASIMKHRPLLSIIQFALSTGFLPFVLGFLPTFYQLSTNLDGGRILPVFLPKICILMIFQKQRSYAVFHVSTLKNADFTVIW